MQNGDVAVDFYHRYKDDIKLMKELNMDAFRFSISWARLTVSGKVKDGVNKEGVQFYNALIDELIANGIQPSMSLYHWDHPQVLEDEYGGFLSPLIIDDFRDFSRVCFEEFGDRVKMWTTINEPYIITVAGYDTGNKAVGRCSKWVNSQCQAGDSATEPYIASHHLLLAHAAAVHEFRKCNKTSHNGQTGIVLSPLWFEPYDSTSLEDNEAVKRALAIELDWHLDPVIHGDYPETLKKQVGKRLSSFTAEQSRMLKNSSDFIGVNYYTARYIVHLPHVDPARPRFKTDQQLEWRGKNANFNIQARLLERGMLFLHQTQGVRYTRRFIKDKYNNPTVYIKENGINDYDDGTKSREDILKDTFRIKYHEDHLEQLHKAVMEDGCDVRGYYAWSLLDNFEWEHGYSTRFGLYFVDYDNNLERYPKDSVKWFKEFLSRVSKSGQEREEEQVWDVTRERSSQEKNNKTLDDPEGFEASVSTIMYLMTNASRRKEEERDRCTFDIPYTRLGIQPSVTLYHWDHPQALEDEYGGFLSPQIIENFRNFARVCFENFGDKVKMWTTINEPSVISIAGYDTGNKAVGRCSKWVNSKCQAGDSATEPYIVSHHLLLSHAAAVQEFRKCNKTSKDGKIGIVISPPWLEPYDFTSSADKHAVERGLTVEIDWHLDPVVYGDYPKIMKKHAGSRLPSFTAEQSKMLRNSYDFIGINYYTARFVAHSPHIDPALRRFRTDHQFERKEKNHSNHLIGPGENRGVLYYSYPEGFRRLLNYVKDKYNNPIVYIKENGINDYDDGTKSRDEILNDTFRISYLTDHLQQLHKAIIDDGCDVRGYYTWSLLDNFEWEHGYSTRFGLYYIDRENDLKRYPKDSVHWFKQFLNRPVLKSEQTENEEGWKEENNNKTLDDSEGFETSIDSIINLMTNTSRIEEEGNDICAFENPNDQLGIKPFVTIYHWDIPQALDDEYGGFLSPRIIDDFRNFARVCFQEFGDKVDMWITFNEPYIYSVAGYDKGNKAMGRCSKWVNSLCVAGDSSTEPYVVSHHLLLAHAAAVEEFRNCDKISQDGKIGIVLSPFWVEPYDVNSHADKEAVERALDYYLGWHLDPLIFGDYPKAIKRNAGKRLPSFTRKQTEMIRNSFDFIGINYYSARYVTRQLQSDPSRLRFTTDQHVEYKVTNRDGDYISSESDELKFIYVYPEGLRKLLNHIKNKYNNPTIYITENGYDDYDVGTVPREQLLKDTKRIEYHEKHLQELHKAITEDGCDVRGYSAWSLLDNFEWEHGYTMRFGLYYVDYADDLKRYAKDSAKWFKKFLERKEHESKHEKQTPLDLFNSIKKWCLQRTYPTSMSKGRASFPKGFLFGTASSSYQYEGAVTEGERGQSMWDHFSNRFPHRISDHSHGNVAVDFFHRYKEDIKRMKDINMDSFRLSIAWPRVIPYGKRERGVSEEGIKFYNDVIDELLANEITPLVTIFHWDTPQDLEDEYGGFLSEQIIDDFRDYASLCFERFGDRVSLWCTLNEPWVYSVAGYDTGRKAPGRCSKYVNGASVAGMSGYEAYIVSHNMLLAHAEAVQVFRKCDHIKNGQIGIAHNPLWYEPYDPSDPDDVEGCNRAMDFMIGWHHHPTAYGDYPDTMKKSVGDRLPSFTPEQSKKLIGSCDYVGINYYSSLFVKSIKHVDPTQPTWRTDQGVDWMKTNIDGKQIAKQGGSEWSFTYPTGLRNVLKYMKKNYDNPRILITENGINIFWMSILHVFAILNVTLSMILSGYGEVADQSQSLFMYNPSIDTERLEYIEGHIHAIHQAIHEDGVRVEGYYVWSLLDNFEWNSGYGVRYGLYYIDYKDGLRRYPKMSALWLKEFLKFDQEDESSSSSAESKKEEKKESYGKQLLHSVQDSGALPAVLGSLFVVTATVGTSLPFSCPTDSL
uniref:thioglucosidase n=1 Tax=Brassica oleracea TaxID=3712 RepID=A0A3P6C5C7_BRAOL|nr:unnamed protein product [Brassica oleracea]